VALRCSIISPVIAVMAIGVSCRFCCRYCAVTTISARVVSVVGTWFSAASAAGIAAAAATQAASAA
jgi:hypothetical protein